LSRSVRILEVSDRSLSDLSLAISTWCVANKFVVLTPRAEGVEELISHIAGDVRLHPGRGSLVAVHERLGDGVIVFELALYPSETGTTVRIEGYFVLRGVPWSKKEYEFVPTVLAVGGVPRKEGLELLASLESTLKSAPPRREPAPPPPGSGTPPPLARGAYSPCGACGGLVPMAANFCPYCGASHQSPASQNR
jgi:hypothetical protein